MASHRLASVFAAIVLSLSLAACGSSPPRETPPGPQGAAAVTGDAAQPGTTNVETGYELGPGDRIRLTVFRHTDLSGEFELDGSGSFAMPLVGEVSARGLSARALEDRIEGQLKEGGYLVSPQVSVEVLTYRPFYIIGEVNNPGSYPYVSGMTVVNAVALAGGYTYRADQDDITITRGGANGNSMDASPTSQVLPGDIIEVPERWF